MNKDSLKEDLLSHIHEQYAINDNSKSQNFTSFLISLFVLFGAYGYTAISVLSKNNVLLEIRLDTSEILVIFQTLTIIVSLILFFLSVLVTNLGYATRRDHVVIVNIRKKTMGDDYENFFPKGAFDATDKDFCNFIPGYYNLFYWLFLGAIILVAIITFCICDYKNDCVCWITMLISIASVFVSLFIRDQYKHKYNTFQNKFN